MPGVCVRVLLVAHTVTSNLRGLQTAHGIWPQL